METHTHTHVLFDFQHAKVHTCIQWLAEIGIWILIYTRRATTKTIYVRYYMETHTHTHTHTHSHSHTRECARVHTCTQWLYQKLGIWVLILVGVEILWEEEGFMFGFKRWQGWAVSKVLWEWLICPNCSPWPLCMLYVGPSVCSSECSPYSW